MEPISKNPDGIRPRAVKTPDRKIAVMSAAAPETRPRPGRAGPQSAEEAEETGEQVEEPAIRRWEPILAGAEPGARKRPRSWLGWGMLAGAAAATGVFILASTTFARLTIVIKPRVEEVKMENVAALFDTSVSKILKAQKVLPAERLSFSRDFVKEFPATGREVVRERARGRARIYNRFSSAPQPLVAGTRFAADSGLIYRIGKSVEVPGAKIEEGKITAQSLEAELVADAPGERANSSGEVTLKIPGFKGGPRYEGFYAAAPQGFAGGAEGEATVVSKEDLKKAEEEVTKALFDELRREFDEKSPPGLALLKELQEIQITKVEAPKPGTRSDRFSVKAQAAGKALAFREADAISLLSSFALEESKDQELVEGSARLSYVVERVDFEKGRADIVISGSFKTKAKVEEQELAAVIKGKKEGSLIEAFKARKELASFSLAFFPPWRSKAPSDPAKIRFRVEEP